MDSSSAQPRVIKFGIFEVDLQSGEVRKAGMRQRLAGQPFQVLQALLEHPQEVVTREQLRQRLWPNNTFVDHDLALKKAVNRLREVLGDSAENPRFIETVPRHGYRFIGSVQTAREPVTVPLAASPPSKRRTSWRLVGGLSVVGFAALGVFAFLWVGQSAQTIRVTQYSRLTNDGRDKSGNLSDGIPSPILTDGTRLYFVEAKPEAALYGLVQISVAGGDVLPIATPFQNVRLTDISPNRTHLLIGNVEGPTLVEESFYSLSAIGGSAQRLGGFAAHDASWSPSGLSLAYATEESLNVTKADGSSAKKLLDGLGAIWWPRWSPDASRLRFTVTDPKTHDNSIWEIAADGTHLHEVSDGWNLPGDKCCGSWTPDGDYFVFQSSQLDVTKVCAVSNRGLPFGKTRPIELTSGPIWASAPIVSPDNKKLFFIGWQPRTETARYDDQSKRFSPLLPGLSIESLDFTRDGKWVAYTAYPGGALWRARADGSERVQLTPQQLYANRPRWSPDGNSIVFFGLYPHRPWKLYLLSAKGGTPTQLIPGDMNEGDPTWSPDGRKVLFGRLPWVASALEKPLLYILDLATKEITPLRDSEGLFSPRWSPSGRYIAALSADSTKLVLRDFQTNQWRLLAQGAFANPEWPHGDTYVYALDVQRVTIVRIRISDGRIEPLVNLKAERVAFTGVGPWTGIAPDDALLAIRDLSIQEIYSAELTGR